MRLLSNSGRAEVDINTLTAGDPGDKFRAENGWSYGASAAFLSTLQHMQHCVVGVLERCEETSVVVGFYFPWLRGLFNCSLFLNQGGVRVMPSLSYEQSAEVKRLNTLEVMTYTAANAQLSKQIHFIEGSLGSSGSR